MNFKQAKTMKVTLGLASMLLAAAPLTTAAAAAQEDETTAQVRELIGSLHVSGVTADALQGKTIAEMIKSLNDPYTVYFSSNDLNSFESSLENDYVGMGARLAMDADGLYIQDVFPGSAAEAAGVKADDYIVAVDGTPVNPKSLDSARDRILGEEGTHVTVTVQRGEQKLDLDVTRKPFNVSEVDSKNFGNGVGYIAVSDFSSDADADFAQSLDDLQADGMQSLIVDLRNNPGGLLRTALGIAKQFVASGTLIHTKDRNGVDNPVPIEGGHALNMPVYVLVNENSASASEVLSGALQDYGVAEVIGMKSYGKGSVQQLYELQDGGALKVTIQEYLTPKLHKVNKVGITPDEVIDGGAAQLITALRDAGMDDLSIVISKHRVTINGVEVSDSMRLLRQSGAIYAPTRALAALIGSSVAWNEEQRAVELQDGDVVQTLPAADADKLILEGGSSYVNLTYLADLYPQLHVKDEAGQVTIQAAKEK